MHVRYKPTSRILCPWGHTFTTNIQWWSDSHPTHRLYWCMCAQVHGLWEHGSQMLPTHVGYNVISVLLKLNSRHDRLAYFGWSLWPQQSLWIIPIPTSKEILYWRHVGPTCLRYARENTGYDSIMSIETTHNYSCINLTFLSSSLLSWLS